jgi:hypothetical protein
MKPRSFSGNFALKSGLTVFAVGVLSVALLLIYNHGLEDTLPLVLYLIAFAAIPLGVVLCLIGLVVNLLRSRAHK